MKRAKGVAIAAATILAVLAFWAALFLLGNLGGSSCDPDTAYDHCGQLSAPGPGGR